MCGIAAKGGVGGWLTHNKGVPFESVVVDWESGSCREDRARKRARQK